MVLTTIRVMALVTGLPLTALLLVPSTEAGKLNVPYEINATSAGEVCTQREILRTVTLPASSVASEAIPNESASDASTAAVRRERVSLEDA